jgi:hypothetical protein
MKNNLLFVLFFLCTISNAQNVAINATGAAPAASAMLDITSTTSGLLIPRMTSAQRVAIASPATGLKVYDTTTSSFWYFNGVIWVEQLGTNNGWALAGNSLAGTEILGSTNAQPVRFFSGNAERMRLLSTGEFVVGSTTAVSGDVLSSYGTYPVSAYSSGAGIGVYGRNTGTGIGVYGTNSSTGTGIFAVNSSATTGRALEVQNSSAGNTDICIGAFHLGNGRAGNFQNNLATNTSITMFASNSSTQNNSGTAAVWGQSSGIRGVVGLANLANVNSIGVNGQYIGGGSVDAIGVLGLSNSNAGWGYGVYGQGNWRALYGNGNFAASGTKAFQIDHPADPANKFLLHYSIESPEVINLYRGTIRLDGDGSAIVVLPDYFDDININYSYQLTAVGMQMPGLYIAEEIDGNNKFKIAGGAAGMKVSWTVMAERNDEWVKQYPMSKSVELEKKPHEKGKYIRPELYNQPSSKAIFNFEEKMAPLSDPSTIPSKEK